MRGNNVMAGYFDDPAATERGIPRRLVPLRRPRRLAPGRQRRAARPRQGHHHLRRREHLLDRGRADDRRPPGRARVRRRRDPAPALGRASQGVRDAQGRCERDRGGDHRVRPRPARALQVPRRGRVRAAAEDVDRQGAEVRAAREGVGRARDSHRAQRRLDGATVHGNGDGDPRASARPRRAAGGADHAQPAGEAERALARADGGADRGARGGRARTRRCGRS